MIGIEVAYADTHQQVVIPVRLEAGSTVLQAIIASRITSESRDIPCITELNNRVGIFGKLVRLDALLQEGDRVEIYRHLRQDPKEARRKKAQINRNARKHTKRT